MPADYSEISPERVAAVADAAIAEADAIVDRLASAREAPAAEGPELTFETAVLPLDRAWAVISDAEGASGFLSYVHPDVAVRDAAQAAEERIRRWRVQVVFRDDVYEVVRAFAELPAARDLEGERRRLLDFWLRDFRRAGHELDRDRRAELEGLRNRLVELEIAFQRAIDDYHDWLDLTPEELEGLPPHYLARLQPGAVPGTKRVSLDYPEVMPFLEQASRRDLRETMERKHLSRAVATNRPTLEEALGVRDRIATILGYRSWAEYALELKMAREPEAVERFYAELVPPLKVRARDEIARLTELLEADTGDRTLRTWDWRYYETQIRQHELGIDPAEVAAHLPLESVMAGMFELTGQVFGLTYRQIPDARAWHPDVQLYEIADRATGEPIATFFADLFPREGKYGHAMALPLVTGRRSPDGSYERPVSAIVANVARPTVDQPSLLEHSEVVTLFHEFGHVLHMSLTRAELSRFSGGETEWDFVEAPSQIMENWTWRADILTRFARHHETGEPIPARLIERLAEARDLNVAIKKLRQIFLGRLDLDLHAQTGPRDLDAICRRAHEVTSLPYLEGTFFPAGFGHLMGGYDAGYYGYLWSEVFGDDMFSRFEALGVTSPEVGSTYRREILEPNGTRDAIDLLRAFLGREPSNEAFLRKLGISLEATGAGS